VWASSAKSEDLVLNGAADEVRALALCSGGKAINRPQSCSSEVNKNLWHM
jgi:hypothetical protein